MNITNNIHPKDEYRVQMPEGPEVKLTSEELHDALCGKLITSLILSDRAKHKGLDQIKKGTQIIRVFSKGKKIVFELCYNDLPFYMCSSLLMEGHWGWNGTLNHIQVKLSYGKRINSKMLLTQGTVYFDDKRYFGSNIVYPDLSFLDDLGPDLLQDVIVFDEYMRVVKKLKIEVCCFLLEQKYFCGVGNYLKAEILYASKIRPDRLTNTLADDEIHELYTNTLKLIKRSYECGGLTIRTYRAPSGKIGLFECQVYEKPYDQHGYEVIKSTFKDKRTTHWVREVQI